MTGIQAKIRVVKWTKSRLWLINAALLISTLCLIPFISLNSDQITPESASLVLIFLGEVVVWLLGIALTCFILLYNLVIFGGRKTYKVDLIIEDDFLKFESQAYSNQIFYDNIKKLEYHKDANLAVSWKVYFKTDKPITVNFEDINHRIKADKKLIETIVPRHNIPISQEIEKIPFYGFSKGFGTSGG